MLNIQLGISSSLYKTSTQFLANMNSRSRSPYVVVRPSVTLLHPTQATEIFRNISMPFGTLAIC